MRDVVDEVKALDFLLAQEVGGVAVAFADDGDERVQAAHFFFAGVARVQYGALDHALEGGGRLGDAAVVVGGELWAVFAQVAVELFAQAGEVGAKAEQGVGNAALVQEREQQVFECQEFVVGALCAVVGAVNGFFQGGGEHGVSSVQCGRSTQSSG